MRHLLPVLAVMTATCASPPRPPARNPSPENPATITIWFADADLPKAELLAGCGLWGPFNILCVETTRRDEAKIRVHADRNKCEPDEKGMRALAWAYSDGKIVFNVDCFKRILRGPDLKMYRLVMTHEVGHELGIWEHVPSSCDKDKPKKHPSGRDVCGRAILNPYYDSGLGYLTDIDALAFDLRDPNWRVVRDPIPTAGKKKETPDCIYYED